MVDLNSGLVTRLDEMKETKAKGFAGMAVVVDRLEIKADAADPRLYDAARMALKVGRGSAFAMLIGSEKRLEFTENLVKAGYYKDREVSKGSVMSMPNA